MDLGRYLRPVGSTRVLVVSDTHLSVRTPEATANWDAIVDHVATTRPEAVFHLGDLALDGTRAPDLEYAREQLEKLPVPWRVIPGNHDVGDNPVPGGPTEHLIDAAARQHWVDSLGADHWTFDVDGWTFFGSGLDVDAEQWDWLQQEALVRPPQRRVALLTHKPLYAPVEELATSPSYRFVPPPARGRLTSLARAAGVELVVSGHVHQYRVLGDDGMRHVWAPSAWAVLPERLQPTLGYKRAGAVSLAVAGEADPELVEPEGFRQLVLGEDIVDPYAV
jgi:3',5'-cyclic AMP phosphodiesterase CpdA